jgi:hypothetical protein
VNLTDWAKEYVKNKDLILRSIVNITDAEAGWAFSVIRKDSSQHFLVEPHLKPQEMLAKLKPEINAALVVLNTRENLDHLVNHWGDFAKLPKLCIIFANPDSSTDKRWVIFPHTHDKITERKTLRRGLDALFMTVEEVR